MNDTHVTDPSGFAPTTTSTPHDLVILGMAAMRSTTLANLVNQSSAQLPVQGTVHNYNVLLGQHGIVGIKTGNNDQDTGAYVFASRQRIGNQSVLIVGAVMNGSSLWGAMQSALPLLASATRGFSVLPVAAAEQAVAAYHPAWGKQIAANTSRSASLLVWGDSTTTISVTVHKLSIPSLSGRSVGTLTVHNSLTGNTVVNLRVAQTIAEPGTWWRLTHPR
jgi:D-alanyl-D-alanine carboxypeptidase (penicillin-binding protein 5/6)